MTIPTINRKTPNVTLPMSGWPGVTLIAGDTPNTKTTDYGDHDA
jgi:hypothetical protein